MSVELEDFVIEGDLRDHLSYSPSTDENVEGHCNLPTATLLDTNILIWGCFKNSQA